MKKSIIKNAIAGLSLMLTPIFAYATLVIEIDTYVTGDTGSNPGTATVATLTITQNGPNAVNFNFENSVNNLPGGIGDDAFISRLEFTYDGTPLFSTLTFNNFGGSQVVTSADFGLAGIDASYDFYLDLDYPTSGGPSSDRFFNGENSTWTITSTELLSESDFSVLVSGSGPDSLAMVHIQQVGEGKGGDFSLKYVGDACTDCGGTGDTGIPEPGTLLLLGAGVWGLSLARRRKI